MNALNSGFGLAKQTAKGTPALVADATWFLATDQSAGAQPRVRQLPREMGGGMLPRGMVKTGVNGMAALRGVPRPDTLGHILLGLAGKVTTTQVDPDTTPASGDEYYSHEFVIDTDPASVPYYTMFRAISNSFGEQVADVKIAALTMDMAAINFVSGEFSMAGIEPTLVSDISSWSPAPAATPPFVACVGDVKLQSADTITTLPVRSATLTIANAQAVDENFIIGSYFPRDIDVIARTATLEFVVLVKDSTLYGKLMYDPAGGSSWLADMFDTASVDHITFKSAEDIDGMTTNAIPYELSLTGAKAQWAAQPISMRGADNVMVRVAGTIIQPSSGDPITLTLKNATESY
jgi:hypothetical protein